MSGRYQSLRAALAAGPTPGPWRQDGRRYDGEAFRVVSDKEEIGVYLVANVIDANRYAENKANAALIAAADPETIAALLAERDALREAAMAMIEWDARENDHAVDFYARMDLCREAFDKARAALALAAQERT